MPKAAILKNNFNGGEFSKLMEGRTDYAKYSASLRRAYNFVLTPQGPVTRRPGTIKQAPVFDETKNSYLVPFVFSDDDTQDMQVEAADLRFRFHSEDGILTQAPVAITAIDNTVANITATAVGHSALVGDQVVLAGFDVTVNLNGRVANVMAVAGNIVTTDVPRPASYGALTTATLALVYKIVTPYGADDVVDIRSTSDTDTVYVFCNGFPPAKLQRYAAYDWRLTVLDYQDGPYGPINDTSTTLTPSIGSGNAVPVMTAANLPSGVASASGNSATHEPWKAFDGDQLTYWESDTNQTGTLTYQFAAPTTVDGYTIEVAKTNDDDVYLSADYSPGDFVFRGSTDGVTYATIDTKRGYVVYDNGRSLYFTLQNAVAYTYYQLVVTKCARNGPIPVRVARLLMTSRSVPAVTFTASATTGINFDQGFLGSDVNRLLRFQGVDANWRWFQVLTRTSATVVTATCRGDPLSTFDQSDEWRLGLFSDTTGYPTCGHFFQDRLFVGGMFGYPDWVAGSVPGLYENMQQMTPDGLVDDDNAIVLKLNARKQGRVKWISTDDRSLLIGTGSGEWAIGSTDGAGTAVTARTAFAKRATTRGSANVEPIQQDENTLFIQRANRTLREMKYVYQVDGYKAPSLSVTASHIGASGFLQMDFAQEPHTLAFIRRGDGLVAALTYNKDQDVVGWQVLDFNGFVECVSVIPSFDGTQDALWLIVRRAIGGVTRRFIERLTRFWDFSSTILDAHFVDCGMVYDGPPITDVYELYDFEGQRIVGLADGSPITPVVVVNGHIALATAASKLVLGIGYDSELEPSRLEAGAADGTAQGKIGRIHELKLRLWDSGGGRYAVYDDANTLGEYVELDQYLDPTVTQMDATPTLFNGDTHKLDMPQSYSTDKTIRIQQSGDIPLPFNLVAMMPSLVTQDQS